jgi:uncharacterized protein YbjT (DUF2867 family)
MARNAIVAGATGLVGGFVVSELLADPDCSQVVVLARRPLEFAHDKLRVENVDFERLVSLPGPVDEVYCCLGTTIRKAGSEAAFSRVDHDHVVTLAKHAKQAGARRFLMVSALGADPRSRIFYNRVKGETERDVAAVGLDAWFFRPSLLDGPRREFRFGERIGLVLMRVIGPLLRGPLAKYRAIRADVVAAAMVGVARTGQPAPGAIESDAIARLAPRITSPRPFPPP